MQNYSPEQLTALVQYLTPEERAEVQAILEAQEHDALDKLCAERVVAHDRGVMYWLRNFTKTENYQWQSQGLQPSEPFPYLPFKDGDWDYLDHVMRYLLSEPELYIPKSREMMTSWLVCGYITWECQFYQSTEWLSQSEKDEKAMGLIKYANTLYSNQPEWMKQRHPLKRGEEGTQHEIAWANGSRYVSLPQGVRQVASYHPKGYFNDESAHQPTWKTSLGVAKQACRQTICVSSAAPSEFGHTCDESLAV